MPTVIFLKLKAKKLWRCEEDVKTTRLTSCSEHVRRPSTPRLNRKCNFVSLRHSHAPSTSRCVC